MAGTKVHPINETMPWHSQQQHQYFNNNKKMRPVSPHLNVHSSHSTDPSLPSNNHKPSAAAAAAASSSTAAQQKQQQSRSTTHNYRHAFFQSRGSNNKNNSMSPLNENEEGREDDNNDEDFLAKFYEHTVDGTCQSIPFCSIEDQLDILTQCRQPLAFLSFFQEHRATMETVEQQQQQHGGGTMESTIPGAYVLPTFCEYCRSPHTSLCSAATEGGCERPSLYFQKKRPPFCPPNEKLWDATTDHAIAVVAVVNEEKDDEPIASSSSSSSELPVSSRASGTDDVNGEPEGTRSSSWLNMFSGSSSI